MVTILSRLLRRKRQVPDNMGASGGKDLAEDVSSILEKERQWLLTQDPDTPRQWQHLRNMLQAKTVRTGSRRSNVIEKVLRPVLVTGILATAAGVLALLVMTPTAEPQIYATGKGQMSEVMLADSSGIILNHTSALTVPRSGPDEPRLVHLSGEAFFRVRKKTSAFTVRTESGSVEVLGTEFNVRDRNGRLEVAVVTGRVEVRIPGVKVPHTIIVLAGSMFSAGPGESAVRSEPIRYENYPGWLHGQLIFQNMPLLEVCQELEARFDVNVRIDHPTLPGESISGTLDSRTPESAVRTLAQLTSMRIRHEDQTFILY